MQACDALHIVRPVFQWKSSSKVPGLTKTGLLIKLVCRTSVRILKML